MSAENPRRHYKRHPRMGLGCCHLCCSAHRVGKCPPGRPRGRSGSPAGRPWAAYHRKHLRLYDTAIEQLSLAGSQAGILNSVAAVNEVRDQAQAEAQRIALAGSALSLNRDVMKHLRP